MTKLEFTRRSKGLSQMRLAIRAGLHPSSITQVERGDRRPWAKFRALISAALNVDEADLFDVSGWPIRIEHDK